MNTKQVILNKLFLVVFLVLTINCAEQRPANKLFGIASSANGKIMQDRWHFKNTDQISFLSVFDGHGPCGHSVADYIVEHLLNNICNTTEFKNNQIEQAITNAFKTTNEGLVKERYSYNSGSTGSIVLIKDNKVYLAWVGDSTIVMSHKNGSSSSRAHKMYYQNSEYNRVKKIIEDHRNLCNSSTCLYKETKILEQHRNNYYRLGSLNHKNTLAMSRGFGDFCYLPFLIVNPTLVSLDIKDINFIILASDGLWDVVTDDEAYQTVKDNIKFGNQDFQLIANYLLELAIERWQTHSRKDNIAIMVVNLEQFKKNALI